LTEKQLIRGLSNIKDEDIRKRVMGNIRTYEGAKHYGNLTPKIEADFLESEVAAAVSNTADILEFAKTINPPGLPRAGEIDCGTRKFIIEVTTGNSSKEASEFSKYFVDPINPNGSRGVILFAPNISVENANKITAAGVKVVKEMSELMNLVKE
jgi:hypothetical protein